MTVVIEGLFRLDAALDAWSAGHGAVPVMAAVRVDGRLAWTRHLDAPQPGGRPSRLPTYSTLKTGTALAALRLQERGRLRLDDRVRAHLPEAPVDPAARVTDLLRHTSGLPDYGPLPAYHAAVRATPSRPWSDTQFLDVARQRGPLFACGQGWSYSNIGYLLVRRLLEAVTGRPFAQVVADEVVTPLGLTDTFVVDDIGGWATCVPGRGSEVDSEGREVDVRPIYHPGWCAPGVGVTTPADLTALYDAVTTDALLTPASRAALLAMVPVPGDHPPAASPQYGLGIHTDAGSSLGRHYGHGGGGPGYLLSATVYPDMPLGRVAVAVAVTSSRGPAPAEGERQLVAALLSPVRPLEAS